MQNLEPIGIRLYLPTKSQMEQLLDCYIGAKPEARIILAKYHGQTNDAKDDQIDHPVGN